MNFFDNQPKLLKEIFVYLNQNNLPTFITGGFVRDKLLNINTVTDIDIEVYGCDVSQLIDILSRFGQVETFGKSFGVVKLMQLPNIDFALARQEVKSGISHRDFEIIFEKNMDYQTACKRRDLTINAILYDPLQDQYIDPVGGIDDINQKVIRVVDKNTFKEDPLRVLRVARMAARLPDFKITDDTISICRNMVDQLQFLSKERVFDEYSKILMATMPSIGFNFLLDIGALPECLVNLSKTMQRSDYHPEGNVFKHTMLVIDIAANTKQKASKPLWFMWACLLHDIGKPEVTTSNLRSPNHDLVGEVIATKFILELSRNKKMAKYVGLMTRCHMVLMAESRKMQRSLPYLRVLKRLGDIVVINDLVLLCCCDKYGRTRIDNISIKVFNDYINKMKQSYGEKALDNVIDGNTLIKLGYIPNQDFKIIIDDCYIKQLEGMSKEELIKYIKSNYRR